MLSKNYCKDTKFFACRQIAHIKNVPDCKMFCPGRSYAWFLSQGINVNVQNLKYVNSIWVDGILNEGILTAS